MAYTQDYANRRTDGIEVSVQAEGENRYGQEVVSEFAECPFCGFVNRVSYVGERFSTSHTCKHRVTCEHRARNEFCACETSSRKEHIWAFSPVTHLRMESEPTEDFATTEDGAACF